MANTKNHNTAVNLTEIRQHLQDQGLYHQNFEFLTIDGEEITFQYDHDAGDVLLTVCIDSSVDPINFVKIQTPCELFAMENKYRVSLEIREFSVDNKSQVIFDKTYDVDLAFCLN